MKRLSYKAIGSCLFFSTYPQWPATYTSLLQTVQQLPSYYSHQFTLTACILIIYLRIFPLGRFQINRKLHAEEREKFSYMKGYIGSFYVLDLFSVNINSSLKHSKENKGTPKFYSYYKLTILIAKMKII